MKTCMRIYNCPVEATLDLIGGKWKSLILWHLNERTMRYNELRKLIPEATAKMLTQQLRDLEEDGLIVRKVYPVVPPKVEYSLSDFGKTVAPVLYAMCDWGRDYLKKRTPKKRATPLDQLSASGHKRGSPRCDQRFRGRPHTHA